MIVDWGNVAMCRVISRFVNDGKFVLISTDVYKKTMKIART